MGRCNLRLWPHFTLRCQDVMAHFILSIQETETRSCSELHLEQFKTQLRKMQAFFTSKETAI